MRIILENNYTIKNKILNIKIIFKNIKNRLKTFEFFKLVFVIQNIIEQFFKIVFKNNYLT